MKPLILIISFSFSAVTFNSYLFCYTAFLKFSFCKGQKITVPYSSKEILIMKVINNRLSKNLKIKQPCVFLFL